MHVYDMIVLLIVAITSFNGWRKGMASQIASVAAIAASCYVATTYPGVIADRIDAVPPWNNYAAMLLLFFVTSIVTWMIFRSIRTSIERMKLGELDQQMGALLGGVKGLVLACIVTLIAVGFMTETSRTAMINNSKSGPVIAGCMHHVRGYLPDQAIAYVGPFFDRMDEIRQNPATTSSHVLPRIVKSGNGFALPAQQHSSPSSPFSNPPFGSTTPGPPFGSTTPGPPVNILPPAGHTPWSHDPPAKQHSWRIGPNPNR